MNEDELVLAISKATANVYLGDVREFINVLQPNQEEEGGERKVNISQVVQYL